MLPVHSAAALGLMLISTASLLAFEDKSSRYPHNARPHGSMRTDPLFPSVCQSPSGVSAGSSSISREILETGGAASAAGRAATVGVSIGGVIGGGIGSMFVG